MIPYTTSNNVKKIVNKMQEEGQVSPNPTAEDNGKVLGVVDGAYTFVEQSGGAGALEVDIVDGKLVINY